MRKKHEPSVDNWQTIYTSLMLIVVAFFIFLISVSNLEKDKFESFVTEHQRQTTSLPAKGKQEESVSIRDRQVHERIRARLVSYVLDKGLTGLVEVIPHERAVQVRITADLLFAAGEAEPMAAALPVLADMAQLVRDQDLNVKIYGHTDNDPITSKRYPSNWELSAARAAAVMKHLETESALPGAGMMAVGFGEHRPLADNATPEGKKQNRRVEMYLSNKPG